jgi:transcriptional regulator with XRE-family HTH domain
MTAERMMPHPSVMDIADLIKAAREAKGISQRELAKQIKVSAGAVGQWETGVTRPSLANRVDLAKYLNIPFVQLLPETSPVEQITVDDPELVEFVRRFRRLPASIREAILMQVVSIEESLGLGDGVPDPPRPTRGRGAKAR